MLPYRFCWSAGKITPVLFSSCSGILKLLVQKNLGWKRPLVVIWSNLLLKACSARSRKYFCPSNWNFPCLNLCLLPNVQPLVRIPNPDVVPQTPSHQHWVEKKCFSWCASYILVNSGHCMVGFLYPKGMLVTCVGGGTLRSFPAELLPSSQLGSYQLNSPACHGPE